MIQNVGEIDLYKYWYWSTSRPDFCDMKGTMKYVLPLFGLPSFQQTQAVIYVSNSIASNT